MAVARVDIGRFDTHRAVQEDRPVVEAPRVEVLCHQVQEILCPPDRERGNKNVTLCGARRFEDPGQFVDRFLDRPVQPVAVGAFH